MSNGTYDQCKVCGLVRRGEGPETACPGCGAWPGAEKTRGVDWSRFWGVVRGFLLPGVVAGIIVIFSVTFERLSWLEIAGLVALTLFFLNPHLAQAVFRLGSRLMRRRK